MSWNKNDPFFIYGLVGTDEWDWRKKAKSVAKSNWESPIDVLHVDPGKYLGLIRRLDELEAEESTHEKK